MKVHPHKSVQLLTQLMLLLVFLLSSSMMQVHIKGNHLLNMRKNLLQLGYRIRQQDLLMELMKMPIRIPMK